MTIREERAALRARLETLDRIRVADEIPGALSVTGNAAAAIITRGPTTFPDTFDGTATRTYTVSVLVSKGALDRVSVDRLDDLAEFTGTGSVYAALKGPIPGVADSVEVTGDSGIANFTIGAGTEAADYAGTEFEVEVQVMMP